MRVRSRLDPLYDACGYVAATFLAGIALCIMAQIGQRLRGRAFDATEAAGFCLAASTFFGLAHTFRHGNHVRIDLITKRLPARLRHAAEIANCAIGAGVVAFLAVQLILFAKQSWEFHDVSPGLLAMPMWLPQAGAAAGVSVLAIALIDELIWLIGGGAPRSLPSDEIAIDETVA